LTDFRSVIRAIPLFPEWTCRKPTNFELQIFCPCVFYLGKALKLPTDNWAVVGFQFELANADPHTGSGADTIATAELIDVNFVIYTRSFIIT